MGTPLASQPPLRGTDPVRPPLLLPPQSPHILLVCLGVLPISLGVGVPHQRLAGTLVVATIVNFDAFLISFILVCLFLFVCVCVCAQACMFTQLE